MRWNRAYANAIATGVFVLPSVVAWLPLPKHHTAATAASAGVVTTGSSSLSTSALRVGSIGWDNENYLEALSQGSDAIDEANAQYQKYSRFASMRPASEMDDTDDTNSIPTASLDDRDSLGTDDLPGAVGVSSDQLERIKQLNQAAEEGVVTSDGGSRFQQLMARAAQGGVGSNPAMIRPPSSNVAPLSSETFATLPPPPLPPPPVATTPALPEGFEKLSVEAQAALFRQLMAAPTQPDQQWPPRPGPRPPATGQAAVAADGRRVGRNRDADAIVNSSDVYFAQLKLDSSVRNQARFHGDTETADSVFADPAIQDIALHINPYMEEARKKEQALLETAVEELLLPPNPYFDRPVDIKDTGVSYKQKLRERQQQKQSGTSISPPLPAMPAVPASAARVPPPPPPKQQRVDHEQYVAAVPRPPVSAVVPEGHSTTAMATATKGMVSSVSIPSSPPPLSTKTVVREESEGTVRQDIRTLMGLLIKHRGGPGFGAGRIQGAEMMRFLSLATTVVDTLRAESSASATSSGGDTAASIMSATPARVRPTMSQLPTATGIGTRAPLPSESVGSSGGTIDGATSARIQSMLSCVDGAMQMIRNAPPDAQEPGLLSLRAALLSAVGTCNDIVSSQQVLEHKTSHQQDTTSSTIDPPSAVSEFTTPEIELSDDDDTAFLETVYRKLQQAAGDGKMGLRNDLSASDAQDLANDISRMRSLLVDELNNDAPAKAPSTTVSKYQEMLDKARADNSPGL